MKRVEVKRFQGILEGQKKRLLESVQKTVDQDLTLPAEDLSDEVDLASNEVNQSIAFRLRDRERVLLQKIEDALDRIEQGEFGVCESCGEEIERKRLEARPVTTLCIGCKEEQEQKERAFA
ncbi:MAG: TraR/DksA C4-type zinc finger protein [Deltaproteobacteria bacterium]|nr:TraR/DksA C4-type zinc finger protein [Deltaproteobacteria bacterium]